MTEPRDGTGPEPRRVEWLDLLHPRYFREFEETQTGPVRAVPTMLPAWNAVCGGDGGRTGLPRGWFVVVGGNPGRGKTLFTLLLAREAIRQHELTAFVSLEMHHTEIASRFYAMAAGVDVRSLEKGRFDRETWGWVKATLKGLFPVGGPITNRGLLRSTEEIMFELHHLADCGTTAFVVDYLQLIGIGDEESINRQVTEAVTNLRAFAVDRRVLVVVVSQFNRQSSANYIDKPRSQGLHGGMIVEASADQVLLLDHSRYEPTLDGRGALTWAILDKNRHGARVEIPLRWDFSSLTIREGMPDEIQEWPGSKR